MLFSAGETGGSAEESAGPGEGEVGEGERLSLRLRPAQVHPAGPHCSGGQGHLHCTGNVLYGVVIVSREMENIIRGPTFEDFVTIRTEASM
jgi:hypothetical protein